jgi:hypothetical protein
LLLTNIEGGGRLGEAPSRAARRGRKKGTKPNKGIISTEQPGGFIENKGVSQFPRSKQTEFSGQKSAIKRKNMAKNPPLMGHFPVCAAPNDQPSS